MVNVNSSFVRSYRVVPSTIEDPTAIMLAKNHRPFYPYGDSFFKCIYESCDAKHVLVRVF